MDINKTYFGYVNKIFIEIGHNSHQKFPVITFSVYHGSLYKEPHLLVLLIYPISEGYRFYNITIHGRGNNFGQSYTNQLYHKSGIRKKDFKKLLYTMYDKYYSQ